VSWVSIRDVARPGPARAPLAPLPPPCAPFPLDLFGSFDFSRAVTSLPFFHLSLSPHGALGFGVEIAGVWIPGGEFFPSHSLSSLTSPSLSSSPTRPPARARPACVPHLGRAATSAAPALGPGEPRPRPAPASPPRARPRRALPSPSRAPASSAPASSAVPRPHLLVPRPGELGRAAPLPSARSRPRRALPAPRLGPPRRAPTRAAPSPAPTNPCPSEPACPRALAACWRPRRVPRALAPCAGGRAPVPAPRPRPCPRHAQRALARATVVALHLTLI
jgi:hypothetical protein